MSITQFAMVEELACLIKDNLPCKHLILSMEEALVNFLQDDTSLDGVIELEPMNPYHRLLVHRLADIFGFTHESVGEEEERHLILERCAETSIPSILVSDLLWQFDEVQSPMAFDVLRRKEVVQVQRETSARETSLEEREAAYFAARQRIFSADLCETGLVKQRPRHNPVVARRMITHALGQTKKAMNHDFSLSDSKADKQASKDLNTTQFLDEAPTNSGNELAKNFPSAKHRRPSAVSKVGKLSVPESSNSTGKGSAKDGKENNIQEKYLRKEHIGAAKRLFANALGIPRRETHASKSQQTKKMDSGIQVTQD